MSITSPLILNLVPQMCMRIIALVLQILVCTITFTCIISLIYVDTDQCSPHQVCDASPAVQHCTYGTDPDLMVSVLFFNGHHV